MERNGKTDKKEIENYEVEPEAPAGINLLVHCLTNMFEEKKNCVILFADRISDKLKRETPLSSCCAAEVLCSVFYAGTEAAEAKSGNYKKRFLKS